MKRDNITPLLWFNRFPKYEGNRVRILPAMIGHILADKSLSPKIKKLDLINKDSIIENPSG